MAYEWIGAYVQAFVILFIIFDPIGNIPIFHSLTQKFEISLRRKIIKTSVLVASIILVFFAIGGVFLLSFFKISINEFMIAGGVLLFILAVEGLLGREEARWINSEDVAIVPLATPLMAGPGAIYSVIYLMASPYGPSYALFSIFTNVILQYLLLAYSDRILKVIGKTGSTIISRIMAFILSAIAVGMIINGVKGAFILG
jgi:multiple antibiotic resistance protein